MLVDFYHLASTPLESVLPKICERLLADDERLLIVAEAPLLDRLDSQLWSYARDSFLPHGKAEAPGAANQPILLSSKVEAGNGAANVALADGVWRDEALGFTRAFYFFDNGHLDSARGSWRALKDRDGIERRYWKQDEQGKWLQGP